MDVQSISHPLSMTLRCKDCKRRIVAVRSCRNATLVLGFAVPAKHGLRSAVPYEVWRLR